MAKNIYAAFLGGQIVQEVKKEIPLVYISEASYQELVQNRLTKLNQIYVLFEVAADTEYLKNMCPKKEADCVKNESIKFVSGYLKARHAITLSVSTIEEMWQVYKGILTFPTNAQVYEKIPKNGYLFHEPKNTCPSMNFNSS